MISRLPWWVVLAIILVGCAGGTSTGTIVQTTTSAVTQTTTAASEVTTTSMLDRVAAWQEDIETLAERMPLLHPNPFWRADEAEFNADVARLRSSVAEMTDDQIILELVQLVARVDGHTNLSMSQEAIGYGRYQIRFYEFDDGLFVVESPEADLVGGRLLSVNRVAVGEVLDSVSPYAQRDNSQTVRNLRPLFLVTPMVLVGEGIIEDPASPSFEIELADRSVRVVDPPVLDPDDWRSWAAHPVLPPARPGAEVEDRFDESIWWAPIGDDSTVYVQYNFVARLGGFVEELAGYLEANDVAKIIVDLRRNPGGNNQTFGAFRELLVESDAAGIEVVMITSRQTFSAAANFSTYIDVETDAVFVGEGMGGSPNLYGDVRPLRLPNSGIEVLISARYWEIGGPEDTRDTIVPDVPVGLSSSDYFSGRDPVLEAALDV